MEFVEGKELICTFGYWTLEKGKEYKILDVRKVNSSFMSYEITIDCVFMTLTNENGEKEITYMKLSDEEIDECFKEKNRKYEKY